MDRATQGVLSDFDNEFSALAGPAAPEQTTNPNGSVAHAEVEDGEDVGSNVERRVEQVEQKKFTRTIKGEDGGGDEVFTADTLDELLDKIVTSKEHASKKIREQNKLLKLKPEKALEPKGVSAEVKPMTVEDRRVLAEKFQLDPVAAMDEYMAGNPEFQAFKQFTATQQAAITNAATEQAFLDSVGDSFHKSPKNATALINYLKSEELPYTAKNLEYAFQELTESGLLEVKTEDVQGQDGDNRGIRVKEHVRTKPQSTGTRNSQVASRRAPEEVNPEGVVDVDVRKIMAEPDIEKAQQMMTALMRKRAKTAASH